MDRPTTKDNGMTKSKKRRMKRKEKENKGNVTEDLSASSLTVRVTSDFSPRAISSGAADTDDIIEVVETAGHKRFMREERRRRGERVESGSDTEDGDPRKRAAYRNLINNMFNDSGDSSFDMDSDDDDEYYYDSGHGGYYCKTHYREMKHRQNINREKKAAEKNRMSENVDGYVGNQSMDFILDFLGEEKEQKKSKTKKKPKKKTQQKGGKKEQKEDKKAQRRPHEPPKTAEERPCESASTNSSVVPDDTEVKEDKPASPDLPPVEKPEETEPKTAQEPVYHSRVFVNSNRRNKRTGYQR